MGISFFNFGDIMHTFFHIGAHTIPAYGFMIALGVIIANIVALFVLKRTKQDFNDFVILEAYCMLGAFLGAKILYLVVSFREIEWNRVLDINYANQLMLAGFVFYGGLIGGLILVVIAGKFHKIDANEYIKNFIFLIPFIHSFGRIGCFLAGCCYGIPYEGLFSVTFPQESYALSGVSLFPVQLFEAGGLMIISSIILVLQLRVSFAYTIELYFVLYGLLRFVLERLRYDEARGFILGVSTSQWISIFLIIFAVVLYCKKKIKLRKTI